MTVQHRHARCSLARMGLIVAGLLLPAGVAVGQTEDWIISEDASTAFNGVDFPVDSVTGYVCGDTGVVIKTTDGGRSWTTMTAPTAWDLNELGFVDNSTGYVSSADTKLYKTVDGGGSWSTVLTAADELNDVVFPVGERVGYLVTDGGDVYKSADNGANWVLQDNDGNTSTLTVPRFPVDATTGWACGDGGTILKRTGQHMVTGVYTGDGLDARQITGLGFQPDVVIVRSDAAEQAWIHTSSMVGDLSKPMGQAVATASNSNRIESLDADGFTVGTHTHVNGDGVVCYFYAWKAEAGVMQVGTYTGDGNDDRWINIGMQPAYMIVWEDGVADITHRFSTQASDKSFRWFQNQSVGINRIQDFNATGFQLGTNSYVNTNTTVYNYIAWAQVAGKMKVGTYNGNGNDDRAFSGLGFRPEVVLIESEATTVGDWSMIRSEALIGDASQCLSNDTDGNDVDAIQSLDDDGFEVGTTQNVAKGAPWHNQSWTYRKKITIDGTKVMGTFTDFPVLISMTDTDLQAARTDGFDILFTDQDQTTKLDHELETWVDATGQLVAWVRVPTLTINTDKDLYVYYGYASASNQQNVNGVWDSNYKAVLHLDEEVVNNNTSANAHDDSTSNNNDGDQTNNNDAPGSIGTGQDFDGTNDRVIIPHSASLVNSGTTLTVSAWIEPDFTQANVGDPVVVDKWVSSTGWKLWFKDSANDFRFKIRAGGASKNISTTGLTWAAGSKHYLVGVYNGTNLLIYWDGVLENSTGKTGNLDTSTEDATIGINAGGTADDFDGDIDEVRISNIDRNANWILTEYNNQFDPSSFYTVGDEQTGQDSHWVAWGSRWDTQTTPTTNKLWGIDMFDESVGLAVGVSDTVLRTVNGGTTWTAESTGSGQDLLAVHMVSATVAYCTGLAGEIFKSTDGGVTWSQQTSQTGVLSMRGLDFPQDATTGFCVGDSGRVVRTNRPLMITGWYTGDGTDNRPITEVGFQPDFVIINGDNELTVCRTSTMTGDASKQFYTAVGLQANWIQTLDTDGFTIGSADEVNADGTTYSWSAFKARGELKVGTYLGTGSDDASFTGIGFEPDYLIVLSEGSDLAMQRFPGAVDETFPFTNGAGVPFTNMIQAMETDGFELGDSVTVNRLNTTYHYVACKELPLQIEVGSYAGVGGDDVSIAGPGFSPDMLLIKSVTAEDPVLRTRSMGSGEKTYLFSASTNLTDEIQALEPNGFQVGSTNRVNESATTYNWVAFRRDLLQLDPRVLTWTEVDPH